MKTIIVDAGSTTTTWMLIAPQSLRVLTEGINPLLTGTIRVAETLRSLPDDFTVGAGDRIYWYGAGCVDPAAREVITSAIAATLGSATVEIHSDMLCAARALFGDKSGIACILGTGSNSCLYDGSTIVDNVPPLGYVLGDEGSGAHLGRALISNVAKRMLPPDIISDFQASFGPDMTRIVRHVYTSDTPSRYLASFAPYIREHIHHPQIEAMVIDAFRLFLRRNVAHYPGATSGLRVGFVGSIAGHFSSQLHQACEAEMMQPGQIVADPAEAIIVYHLAHI